MYKLVKAKDIEALKENNKLLLEQINVKNKDCVQWQKEIKKLNKEICSLKIELEDTKLYLKQEKECSDALRIRNKIKEIKTPKEKKKKGE